MSKEVTIERLKAKLKAFPDSPKAKIWERKLAELEPKKPARRNRQPA